MKVYLIKAKNSYRKDEVVAVAMSKKKVKEWLIALDLREYAKHRHTDEFTYQIDKALKNNNLINYKFFSKETAIDYYIVEELTTI